LCGDNYSRAEAAANKALDAGESVAEGHTAAAFVQFVFDWDWLAAETNCRQAVALDPTYGQGHWMLGHAISQQGLHDEPLPATRRAPESSILSTP
jgi:hypothetical protein